MIVEFIGMVFFFAIGFVAGSVRKDICLLNSDPDIESFYQNSLVIDKRIKDLSYREAYLDGRLTELNKLSKQHGKE